MGLHCTETELADDAHDAALATAAEGAWAGGIPVAVQGAVSKGGAEPLSRSPLDLAVV